MDYVIILFFIVVSTMMLYICVKNKMSTNRIVILLLYITFVVLFCGLRSVIPNVQNSDAYEYYKFYQTAQGCTFKEYLFKINQSEILFYAFFWIFANLEVSYSAVRCLYYIILSVILLKLLDELDTSGNSYLDFCFFSTNMLLSYCLMRNCLGYIFGWYAIVLLFNNKIKRSLLVSIIGCLVHSSCVIVLAFVLFSIGIQVIKNLYLLILFIIICFGIVSWGMPKLLLALGRVNTKIAYYIYINEGSFAVVTNLIRILIFMMMLLLFDGRKHFYLDNKYKNILILTCFSLMIIPAQLANGIAYRFLPYFDVLNIIAFGYIRGTIHTTKIVMGNIKMSSVLIWAINMAIVISFVLRSLTGYGLIPIQW